MNSGDSLAGDHRAHVPTAGSHPMFFPDGPGCARWVLGRTPLEGAMRESAWLIGQGRSTSPRRCRLGPPTGEPVAP